MQRVPPHAYFVVSAVFHYLGPAFAVLLFARVDVLGVAWLRIAAAALVFALWRRPWRVLRSADPAARRLLLGWGVLLAVMNCCFYLAIDRLPLGTVAAIEFLPVIALAALGARSPRNALALALAVPGVYLLTGVRLEGEPLGVALALANAVLFAAYIVLAHRVARLEQLGGIDGLAAAMLVAVVAVTPMGGWEVLPALTDPVALLAGIGVGVASSVGPLRRRPARDGPPGPRDLRADGVAAAGDRDGHRRRRPGPDPVVDRGRGRRARHRRGGAAPAAGGRGRASCSACRAARPRDDARRQRAAGNSASAASTTSSWVFGEAFGMTWRTTPASSRMNVARRLPKEVRPYIDFSAHTP